MKEPIGWILRTLSYFSSISSIRKAIKTLCLKRIGKRCYFYFVKMTGNMLPIKVNGIIAWFSVLTFNDLQALDLRIVTESHLLKYFITILQIGDTFYDVGANDGFYTIILAKLVGEKGQVIAFEPEKRNYHRLQENLRINKLTNVRCFHKALGDYEGEGELYGKGGLATLISISEAESYKQVVEVIEGDRIREVEALPIPRAIKIDVEGYEYEVIRGLYRTLGHPDCELVCCEVHPNNLPPEVKPKDIINQLKFLGFSRMTIFSRGDTFHALCYKSRS